MKTQTNNFLNIKTNFLLSTALGVVLMSNPMMAKTNGVSVNQDHCNFNLEHDFKYIDNAITFTDESGKEITIDQDNNLIINGTLKDLNSNQRSLISDYADGIRVLIPEVKSLALEGVNIGVTAAGMALGVLLGENDPDYSRFNEKIQDIANLITEKINAENFDSTVLESQFGDEFENELESVVEQAVEEITPRIMAKVMTAAMSGDESGMNDFEARAKNLESDIEAYVEPQAEALEARAEELCFSVDELNKIEDQLVESGIQSMDIIVQGKGTGHWNKRKHAFNLNFND